MEIKSLADVKSLLLDNRSAKQTIVKNTFWLTVSEIINRLFKLIIIIYIAREVGVADYGRFTFSLAFVSIFLIFSDFGLSLITTREFSKTRSGGNNDEYSATLSLKILLSIGALILIAASSFLLNHDPAARKIILILSFYVVINDFSEIIYAFFRSRQQMEVESWSKIIQATATLLIGFFVILKLPSIENLSYSYLFASAVSLAYILFFFHFKVHKLSFNWNRRIWLKLLAMSWPLAVIGFLGTVYGQIDSVIMGSLGQIVQTGWYGAANKIVDIIIIPALLIAQCFFPAMSKVHEESKEEMQKLWDFQAAIIVILTIPIIAGGVFLASKIIFFFYRSAYEPSALAFQILMFSVMPLYFYSIFHRLFIIFNRQKQFLSAMAAVVAVSCLLKFALISRFSLYGASFADVIAGTILFFTLAGLARFYTPVNPFNANLFKMVALAVIAALAMSFIILTPAINNLNILIVIIIGAVFYFLILAALMKILRVKII
jgi:O-antigen/teichoic acid export membrane protein